eukprot:CAMPEP_0204900122 /NCGR_PEP_ID=MMETSP1397-20131031/2273_1 /ASSEMBLY_ACC=CAM_ASM_000891 /TAXON_ID=49980 /ORGANISM="Climacostomum Climacostomum virens, Strain Stock W-24" /LENGTH=47 /DNA_ID= /DNA_START= /DNA_END= /DNA_ORIENTATION=
MSPFLHEHSHFEMFEVGLQLVDNAEANVHSEAASLSRRLPVYVSTRD